MQPREYKKNCQELKSLSSPPALVEKIMNRVMICLGKKKGLQNIKTTMANPEEFGAMLMNYEKDNVTDKLIIQL